MPPLIIIKKKLAIGDPDVPDINPDYYVSPQRPDGSYETIGFLGVFRTGNFQVFNLGGSHTFKAPAGRIRIRVIGRGGISNSQYSGLGGGGYAHGIFNVTKNETLSIIVPAERADGNKTFADYFSAARTEVKNSQNQVLLYATNGTSSGAGVGSGGDYQSTGGAGGIGSTYNRGGSGASGSQSRKIGGKGGFGNANGRASGGGIGGNATDASSSNISRPGGAGGAATSTGVGPGVSLSGLILPPGFPRFPFDGFYGAGGSGLPGAGASINSNVTGVGGGNSGDGASETFGAGSRLLSRGLVIIEW
jgi:hypothetical protein